MAIVIVNLLVLVALLAIGVWATTPPGAAETSRTATGASEAVSSSRCPDDRQGIVFYRGRYAEHREARGIDTPRPVGRTPRNCADADYLAEIWPERAFQERITTERWYRFIDSRTLHDFVHTEGSHAWSKAVDEVQRPYPGTQAWLMSCSASEGGWGRWVPNSQGSGVGGWLQFMPGTWAGFYRHAVDDVRARGFRVPESSASWYSTLGQALAGAWGITHGMRHHWAGAGCW
jgi:hypothetical protein